MKRLLLVTLLLSLCSAAQTTTQAKGGVTTALLQKEWDAWCTLDPAKAAKYYDTAPSDVFFDITPFQYHGWAEYETGVKQVLAGFKSCTAKVDEVHIHPVGNVNWLTAVIHMEFVTAEGIPGKDDWRWTAVWAKRGNEWKIVHEHVSAPLPPPKQK